MDSNYKSKYSGEQVDAAVEYFLQHSSSEESTYDYSSTIFCAATSLPSAPFDSTKLPISVPEFPFAGTDGNLWYDVPNDSTSHWYQCIIRINSKSKKVVSQGSVMDIEGASGDKGDKGDKGDIGDKGDTGDKGDAGNFTEFRYHRTSQYVVTLTDSQKNSRTPSGWYLDWNTADVPTYTAIQQNLGVDFDTYLCDFAEKETEPLNDGDAYFDNVSTPTTFNNIAITFYEQHQVYLSTPSESVQAAIIKMHTAFKKTYDKVVNQTATRLVCATEYHKLIKDYIDEDHIWFLFQINATIEGSTDSLIGQWSEAQRIQGEDGKPGPQGSTGISGTPGVSMGVAFTLGTETSYRPDAANPTASPYNINYNALFASGTYWFKYSPDITTAYPYIWYTQCRYIKDSDGNITFEDVWSTPQRYTGKDGITKEETIITRNPIIYPAGIWSSTTGYNNDGYRAPYVYYDGLYYYVSGQGTAPIGTTPDNASTWWTKLEGFEALYTKVGIIANGLIGSVVFNGDYVFSQQGIDVSGNVSTKYQNFNKDNTSGEEYSPVDPYNTNAAFRPNFCLNCRTGEVWSTSRDSAISTASSEILQKATEISLQVKDTINGELSSAGIDITSSGVKVTGEFSGTMGGTFNGDISAKSLTVVGDDGLPVMRFDTYEESMGTPEGGTAPPVGAPVLIMSYQGTNYLVNMLTLKNGTSTGNYKQVNAATEALYTTTSVNRAIGTQGSANYHKITTAPYLILLDDSGQETTTKIAAKLYDTDGETLLEWSSYLNKYYSGTLISEYAAKTSLSSGIWAFKLTGSLATASSFYLGSPQSKLVGLYLGNVVGLGNVYYTATLYYYLQASLLSGTLSKTTTAIGVVAHTTASANNGVNVSGSTYRYVQCNNISVTASQIMGTTVSSTSTTSKYFLEQVVNSNTITTAEIMSSHQIVGPVLSSPTVPPISES